MAAQPEAGYFRPVGHGEDPGGHKARHEILREIARPEAVDQNPDPDAACGRKAQGGGHFVADCVVGVDVGFEVDLELGRRDFGKQGREVFASRIEQGDLVAGPELSVHFAPGGPTAQRGRKSRTTVARNGLPCAGP